MWNPSCIIVRMSIPRLALVIVTYNRSALLHGLLQSIANMTTKPWKVIVVDNASTDDTPELLEADRALFDEPMIQIFRSETNTGGSGGFSKGVDLAVQAGAEWIWVMDDDVEVLPDALERMEPWTHRFRCLHGRRYDVDGTPFYWQARFNQFLGVPLPYTIKDFNDQGFALTNSGTFEGMLIATDIVRKIGLPDPRFFISWDDAIYAWLASHYTEVAYVNEFLLQKKRRQRQIKLVIRHLNDSSSMVKYYMMRNRGHVWHYFRLYGELNRFGFGLGTFLTYLKEILRLLLVEHNLTGLSELNRGVRDAAAIRRDTTWRPMPPLPEAAQ